MDSFVLQFWREIPAINCPYRIPPYFLYGFLIQIHGPRSPGSVDCWKKLLAPRTRSFSVWRRMPQRLGGLWIVRTNRPKYVQFRTHENKFFFRDLHVALIGWPARSHRTRASPRTLLRFPTLQAPDLRPQLRRTWAAAIFRRRRCLRPCVPSWPGLPASLKLWG